MLREIEGKPEFAFRDVSKRDSILKSKLKSIVGTVLTYHWNYVKKTKLFNVLKSQKDINEFTKFLFGSKSSYDRIAANLRFFRDEHYPDWKADDSH